MTVLPLIFYLMANNKNDSVTPYVFYLTATVKKTTVLPFMFYLTTNKKRQCYPLCFIWWRPIKNNSVTPCVLFDDDQWKTIILPLVFYLTATDKKTTVLPFMFYLTTNKKRQCYPLCFIWWRPIKNNSVTPCVLFDDDQ